MTRLANRKTKLTFVTDQTARYRGKERDIVVEVFPSFAELRLAGARTRYEISWRGIYDVAAEVFARRERERKKAERAARKLQKAAR